MSREPARLRISPPITPSWRDSGPRALRRCESRHLPRQNGAIVGTAPDGDLDARAIGVSGNESGNACRIPERGRFATSRLGAEWSNDG